MATQICIMRHGETDWNVNKRIQGQTDIPLNETGHAQAQALASNTADYDFTAIYSSDLSRAYETAQKIAIKRAFEVKTLPNLRERHFGIFQGLTADEGAQRHPEAYAYYIARDPDYDFVTGESLLRFAGRVETAIDHLAQYHSGETIAVVSHAGVLDILYRKATGRPLHSPRDFSIPNGALNRFRIDERGWHLEAWGDHPHLVKALIESAE